MLTFGLLLKVSLAGLLGCDPLPLTATSRGQLCSEELRQRKPR